MNRNDTIWTYEECDSTSKMFSGSNQAKPQPWGERGGHEAPLLIYLQLIPAGKGEVSCLQCSVCEHINFTQEQAPEVAGQHKTRLHSLLFMCCLGGGDKEAYCVGLS